MRDPSGEGGAPTADFERFEASELYCRRCRRATPARRHLLLVLPSGSKYDYRCSVCGEVVGSQTDDDGPGSRIVTPR